MKKMRRFLTVCLILLPILTFAQKDDYFMSKVIEVSHEEAIAKLEEAVKEEGFGVVNKLPIHESVNKKVTDANMKPYVVMGVCNPTIAFESIQKESNIGVFMPCKIIIKYVSESSTEVVIVKPSVTMSVVNNDDIHATAKEVTAQLEKVLSKL